MGSPKEFAAARVVAQGSQPCTLGSHPGLAGEPVSLPSQGQRDVWWQDTSRQAAESWLQQGDAWGAGTIPLVPPRTSLPSLWGFRRDPGGVRAQWRRHHLQQLRFSSLPSSFSSEAAFTFISIFSLAAAAFVPREPFWRMPLTEMCFLIP